MEESEKNKRPNSIKINNKNIFINITLICIGLFGFFSILYPLGGCGLIIIGGFGLFGVRLESSKYPYSNRDKYSGRIGMSRLNINTPDLKFYRFSQIFLAIGYLLTIIGALGILYRLSVFFA